MALSEFTTCTTCGVDSSAASDPSGYVVLWDNGNLTNVTMSALSFTQDVSAGTTTMNVITSNVDNRDNYRGCYCMRAYTIASRYYQCSPFAFVGDFAFVGEVTCSLRSRFKLCFTFARPPPLMQAMSHE